MEENDQKSMQIETKQSKIHAQINVLQGEHDTETPKKTLSKFDESKFEAIAGVVNNFNNILQVVTTTVQCFRSIHHFSKGIKDKDLRNELQQRYPIEVIPPMRAALGIINNKMTPEEKKYLLIPTLPELENARNYHIIQAQKLHFADDYQAIKEGRQISPKSQLRKFNPMMKKNGLVYMKSRLSWLNTMPEQVKNPIILPKNAKITSLIVLEQHKMAAHAGPELTLRNTRTKYWTIGGRQQIRKILRMCENKLCRHPDLQYVQQQMANLPLKRISPGNFEAVALDFAGPFDMKICGICKNTQKCSDCNKKTTNKPSIKRCTLKKVYICIFVCHASRGVHLELLMDKTTESFLLAIKRFSNRRGMPKTIHSDNAKEIIQAKNNIKDLYQKLNTAETHRQLAIKYGITWYHSPDKSPRHNGVVERLVQTIKKPFYKTLNCKIMTETELYTILTDVEASTNMRPLTATSEGVDDNNLLPITPSHLIIGQPLVPLPSSIESTTQTKKMDTKERWKERKIFQHIIGMSGRMNIYYN